MISPVYRHEGEIFWVDLKSRTTEATSRFFRSVFGWETRRTSIGDREYVRFHLGESILAGLTDLSSPWFPDDLPPHVSLYVAVDDVERVASAVEPAGGDVLLPPFDVFNWGRMATIQDPCGAVVSLWQRENFLGMTADPLSPYAISHFELSTSDSTASSAFYASILGWKTEDRNNHAVFVNNGNPVAKLSVDNDAVSEWHIAVRVDGIDAVVEQIKASNGTVVEQTGFAPGRGSVNVTGPDGIRFRLVTSNFENS